MSGGEKEMRKLYHNGPEDDNNNNDDTPSEPLPDWDWENITLEDLDF